MDLSFMIIAKLGAVLRQDAFGGVQLPELARGGTLEKTRR